LPFISSLKTFEDGLKSYSKSRKPGGFWESFRTVAYAILIAVGVRTFAYEPFNIPSGSMYPTVLVGDYLFVSKLSYGYSRYSLPYAIPLFSGRIFASDPERGDVVVFRLPREPDVNYIKRLVGLPGDRIQVIGGILNINGTPVRRRRIEDFVYVDGDGSTHRIPQYIETLPSGREHRILEESDDQPFDNTREYVVPPGHYFMMGDNRDNSVDSRRAVGYVPEENLIGRATVLFFSHEADVHWWEFWKWPTSIRYGRLLQSVD
jgi:signal peptidase I